MLPDSPICSQLTSGFSVLSDSSTSYSVCVATTCLCRCSLRPWRCPGERRRPQRWVRQQDTQTHFSLPYLGVLLMLLCSYWVGCERLAQGHFQRVSCWYQTCVLLMGCGPGSPPGCAWYYKAISQLKYLDILYFGYSGFLSGKAL